MIIETRDLAALRLIIASQLDPDFDDDGECCRCLDGDTYVTKADVSGCGLVRTIICDNCGNALALEGEGLPNVT